MRMPKFLFLRWHCFKDIIRNNILHTYQTHNQNIKKIRYRVLRELKQKEREKKKKTEKTSIGFIRIVDGALDEILVEPGAVVVSLYLARHVVTIDGEGTRVVTNLLYGLQ